MALRSIIDKQSFLYRGTPAWKPRETLDCIPPQLLSKWDVYSFGLLVWAVVASEESCVKRIFLEREMESFETFWEVEPAETYQTSALTLISSLDIEERLRIAFDHVFRRTLIDDAAARADMLELCHALELAPIPLTDSAQSLPSPSGRPQLASVFRPSDVVLQVCRSSPKANIKRC